MYPQNCGGIQRVFQSKPMNHPKTPKHAADDCVSKWALPHPTPPPPPPNHPMALPALTDPYPPIPRNISTPTIADALEKDSAQDGMALFNPPSGRYLAQPRRTHAVVDPTSTVTSYDFHLSRSPFFLALRFAAKALADTSPPTPRSPEICFLKLNLYIPGFNREA